MVVGRSVVPVRRGHPGRGRFGGVACPGPKTPRPWRCFPVGHECEWNRSRQPVGPMVDDTDESQARRSERLLQRAQHRTDPVRPSNVTPDRAATPADPPKHDGPALPARIPQRIHPQRPPSGRPSGSGFGKTARPSRRHTGWRHTPVISAVPGRGTSAFVAEAVAGHTRVGNRIPARDPTRHDTKSRRKSHVTRPVPAMTGESALRHPRSANNNNPARRIRVSRSLLTTAGSPR
jgi:hypothetical protein